MSALAEAFTRTGVEAIFVLTSSDTFRSIQRTNNRCGDVIPVRKLASILVHEEAHVRNGAGEREAYQAQLATLARLGVSPGSALYTGVTRSMRAAVAAAQVSDRPRMVAANTGVDVVR